MTQTISIELVDEGTLDRVYTCHCSDCGVTWREAFSNTGEGFPVEEWSREQIEESHYVECNQGGE